jgi:PAS domain S-box-containing protein
MIRLRGRYVTTLLCVLALIWGVLGAFLAVERAGILSSAEREVRSHALALERQSYWLFANVEQLLRAIRKDLEDDADRFDLGASLSRYALPAEITVQVAVIDRAGFLVASNLGVTPGDTTNYLDRPHVSVHVARDTGQVFIGTPVVGRNSGRWSIPVSVRVNGPDGGFAGVVVVSVDPFAISAHYRALDLGEGGVATLVGRDTIIRARSRSTPEDPTGLGQSVSGIPVFARLAAEPAGTYPGTGAVDGVERIFAYHSLQRFPLVILAGRSVRDALVPWNHLAAWALGAGAVLSLAAFGVAARLARAAREREAQRRTLEVAEGKFRALTELSSDWYWECDAEGRFTAISQGVSLLGLAPERLVGRRREDVAENPADPSFAEYRRLLAERRPFRDFRYAVRGQDGALRHASVSGEPMFDHRGRFLGFRGSGRDRTAEVEAYRRVEEGEARLTALVGTVGVGIVVVDGERRIRLFNPAAERLFGWSPDEVLGRPFETLVPSAGPTEEGERRRGMRPDDEGASVQGREVEALRRDGSRVPVELSLREFRTPEGTMVVASMADLAERNRALTEIRFANERLEEQATHLASLAEDLDAAKRQAEAANQAKSDFLANMSHEIRTPMNGVMGMTQILLGTSLTPEQRAYAETVRESAEALLGTIDDILDISKLEAGRVELEEMPFAVEDLVDGVVEILAPRARDKGVEIAALVGEDVRGTWLGDPTRLRQILLNLAGNAVKFTERGAVSIEVQERPGPAAGQRLLRFAVQDTGIGLSPEEKARLFRKFTQADASVTRRFGGTGLGLAITRELVWLMGGTVGVESEQGRGSTFWVEVPLERGEAEAPMAPADQWLEGLRVLVVDDVALNRKVALHHLTALGVDGVEAEGGAEALRAVEAAALAGRPFDLVLVDHGMPGVDGPTLGSWLRGHPAHKEIKLVLATSYGAASAAHEVFEATVSKPIRRQALLDALGRACGRRVAVAAGPAGHGAEDAPAAPPGLGRRVLLVEDNPTNQAVATILLERDGYAVAHAEDGAAAVAACAAASFDAVLMDVQMPVMDGKEATRRIRAAEVAAGSAHTPIIAVTANAMAGMREEYLAVGMDDFIAKPFNQLDFSAKLRRWAADGAPAAGRPGPAEPPRAAEGPVREGPAPLLDDGVLAGLQGAVPPERFAALVAGFVQNGVARVEEVGVRAAAGDLDGLRQLGHDLISTAGNCGLVRLRRLGDRLHDAAAAGDAAGAVEAAREIAAVGPASWTALRRRFLMAASAAE